MLAMQEVGSVTFWVGCLAASQVQQPPVPSPAGVWATCSWFGLLGGAAAGSVLSGGLGNLIKELQESGHGRVAQSWVGTGDNEEIAPNDLARALGDDTLATLSQQTGIGHEDLLAGLSQHLPDLINQRRPTADCHLKKKRQECYDAQIPTASRNRRGALPPTSSDQQLKSVSAEMNVWLHKQVMTKLAESGGNVPDTLKA